MLIFLKSVLFCVISTAYISDCAEQQGHGTVDRLNLVRTAPASSASAATQKIMKEK